MSGSVVIAGPANPAALAHLLDGRDRELAESFPASTTASVNHLVEALLGLGQRVEVVTLAECGETIVMEGAGLRVLVGRSRVRARARARDLFRAERRQVAELIRGTSGAVVNAHWTYEYALGAASVPTRALIVSARDAPLTVLRHSPDVYRGVRAVMAYEVRRRRPSMIANSPYLARAWRRQMLLRDPVKVIPNVVETPLPAEPRSEAHAPIILDVGNGGRLKNVRPLICAMPTVLEQHPRARLVLVGHGLGADSPLASVVSDMGIAACVEFEGPQPQSSLSSLYATASVFAHPSREESFGTAVAEAMSYGLPVVGGFRSGAVPWLLAGGRAGKLADVGDPADIARAINSLLASPDECSELGQAARRRIASLCSPGIVAAAYMETYEDAERMLRSTAVRRV